MAKKPRWRPSDEEMILIEKLSGFGMTESQLANLLGVSISTFQLAEKAKDGLLRQCLLRGRDKAKAKVGETAYRMATSGKCPAMTIFWLKTQCRWKEPPSDVVFPDKDGNPQPVSGPQIVLTMPDNGRSVK